MIDKKNYNIGLDIGTTSVGWAVTDDNFQIIRKGNKRKPLWGVLLFKEADTAMSRRAFRSSRRRYDRRRERIKLLQEIFQEEINKVDVNFYTKLQESFFIDEDHENKTIVLSKEEKEAFKNYQNKYPTIYHLRQKLMTSKEKEDIRLIYLAIHHMIKYRGNFNYNTENFKIENIDLKNDIKNIIATIIDSTLEIYNVLEPNIDLLDYKRIEEILSSTNKRENKKELEKELQNLFTKKTSTELANAFVGYTVNLENLFNIEIAETKKIDFKAADFSDKLIKIEDEIGEFSEIIANLKDLYDEIELKLIFKDEDTCSISNLMVKNYQKHHEDLKLLKGLLQNYPNLKHKLFKDKIIKENNIIKKEEFCIYTKYVRNAITYLDFTKELTKIFEEITNDENSKIIEKIYEELASETFMPRIADTSNGKYPYQINEAELKIIINNQSLYYPFLKDEINGELKLVKLLKFRIPYYVGPLVSKEKSNFAWMVRKNNDKITPFNFDDVVDKRKSAKEFILKMLGHCSYLLNEYSMPTNSILYSKFKVLNELKQIKINNKSISDNLSLINDIYEEFFLKVDGSLTNTKFINYLRVKDDLSMYIDENQIDINVTGYSAENKFANNMNSYRDFFSKNGFFEGTNLTIEDAEKIIELITIFEDKEILKEEILELYPMLNNKINKIINKKYKGWSSLSKKLLVKKYYPDKETGIKKSIFDLMCETKENFMQILNNPEYHFWDMINEENALNQEDNKLNYSLIDNLVTSPLIKKGIWESLKVVDEIVNYMGYEPSNISIEMARGEDKKKGRVDDRKKQLQNLYDKAKDTINGYKELNLELKNIEKITTEKLLLYFLQEGKSLYSGTPLDIMNLQNYEVDHILPQTLIKDDSIDNKALVLKEENQIKRDSLVLPSEFRKQAPWWSHLKKINLISSKKYNNLVRSEFRDKDIEGFINRQLVETRQITKHVANILKNLYKDANIIYFKAIISHNYRDRFQLYKYRDLNDYHHAHDAYLASVLGIYQNKYLKTKVNKFELKDLIHQLIEEKKYDELKYGYVVNSIDQDFMKINAKTGEVFNVKDFTETIENTLYRNDIEVVKKTEIKTGELYNQTKNKKGLKGVPLKKGLKTEWYGAYTSLNPAYAILVRYTKSNQVNQRLIGIPIYYDLQKNSNIMKDYIAELLDIKDIDSIEVLKDKIPFNTLLDWNGQICYLVGATDKIEVCNAKEFNIEKEYQKKWKNTLNRLFNQKKKGIEDLPYNNQLTDIINYVLNKIEKEYKLYFNLIPELRGYINQSSIENVDIETKEKTLLELFKLLKCNSQTANLKHLNPKASAYFGRKNMKIISNATIIKKTSCGIRVYKDEF